MKNSAYETIVDLKFSCSGLYFLTRMLHKISALVLIVIVKRAKSLHTSYH